MVKLKYVVIVDHLKMKLYAILDKRKYHVHVS